MVTPGTAYFGYNQVLLDTNMMVDKVEELNEFAHPASQDSVYLQDIGHAEDSYAIQTSRVRIDGHAARCYVPIYRHRAPAASRSSNGVKERILHRRARLSAGNQTRLRDGPIDLRREAIHSLIEEGVIGAVSFDHDPRSSWATGA